MNNKFCIVHNEPAEFCKQDEQQNQVYICRFCKEQRFNIKNKHDVENEEKQALKQLEMWFDQNIKLLKDFALVLEQFTQQIQQKLRNFKLQVKQSLSNIIEKKNQVKDISSNFTNLQIQQINEQKSIINSSLAQIILQLNTQIKELEISSRLNQLYQSIDIKSKLIQQDIDIENQLVQSDDSKIFEMIDIKFDYQLLQQSSYQQNQYCYAIAFNKDATIMIASCQKLIKVFEFKDDQLQELQQLDGHSSSVYCLYFMKKSNQFISGSFDTTLIIWEQNQNYQWLCNQILQSHTGSIYCIKMNQNEDLLISGSHDNTIKFWKKQNDTWNCNQSIDCQSYVWSISLNDQENELIASVENKQILLLQLQGNEWKIKQNISVDQRGYRICYINKKQFVFQPSFGQHVQIFHNLVKENTYHKGYVFQYHSLEKNDYLYFPIQYVSQIGLIIIKSCNHVYLIKRKLNGLFTLEQSINFDTNVIFGCITDDGKYIATWDDKSKKIQVRKFEF